MRQWIAVVGVAACTVVGVAVAQQAAPAPAPAAQAAPAVDADAQGMPAGPGREIVERACTACHGVDTIQGNRGTVDDWTQTVNLMVSRGAEVADKDVPVVIQYLAKSFPPANATPAPAAPAKPAGTPQSKVKAVDPKTLAFVRASGKSLTSGQ